MTTNRIRAIFILVVLLHIVGGYYVYSLYQRPQWITWPELQAEAQLRGWDSNPRIVLPSRRDPHTSLNIDCQADWGRGLELYVSRPRPTLYIKSAYGHTYTVAYGIEGDWRPRNSWDPESAQDAREIDAAFAPAEQLHDIITALQDGAELLEFRIAEWGGTLRFRTAGFNTAFEPIAAACDYEANQGT